MVPEKILVTQVDAFLVKAAERIWFVFAKRRNALKACALIEIDGGGLMDATFESQEWNAAISGVVSEMIQHHFGIT